MLTCGTSNKSEPINLEGLFSICGFGFAVLCFFFCLCCLFAFSLADLPYSNLQNPTCHACWEVMHNVHAICVLKLNDEESASS